MNVKQLQTIMEEKTYKLINVLLGSVTVLRADVKNSFSREKRTLV